jgi:hypothetical protein
MKLKTKPVRGNILKSIPYDTNVELSGFIQNGKIFYVRGHRTNCPSFPGRKYVFHTHIDLQPNNNFITLPDLLSPLDSIVFLVSDSKIMYIKTARIFLKFVKSNKTRIITNKVIQCISDGEKEWKQMTKKNQHERMVFYILHYLKRGLHKRNSVWNLSWKRILEQIFKIKVNIQPSDIKDPL